MSASRQREPRQRDAAYLAWIRRCPCVACAAQGRFTVPCEAAHVKLAIAAHGWRGWGLGEKSNDKNAAPLCVPHHRTGNDAQHAVGERKFWIGLGVCPGCLCENLNAAYEADHAGIEVIYQAVRAQAPDHL